MVANVVEELQGLKKKLAEENDDDDVMKKYNSLRSAAIDQFQETNIKRSFVSDLNKLLIVQGIIKIDRQTDPAFVSFGRKMKLGLYGPNRRLPTKLKDAITDVLEQCRESQDYDEVEEQLNAIKLQNTGINARIVKTLLLLWDHMTIKKKQSSEMRLQSGVVAAVCNIFRLTKAHDPHGCNSILFDCDALKRCRPEFVVEVDNEESFVNVAGEIKGEKSCPERLALGVYRLGVFGLHMLWKSRMKNSLVFQAEGIIQAMLQ
ncbi:hypothetical protein A0J61_11150 [Choanephora cucurbitarum]|uniref:Uncharacterized protein n=1 Tax=Choanephora cucurbitarum TaxID=101091 RepID=A0A1C7MVD9_9FUNG|nr:hypothetical protein A0J61_11150 [Choanephora cucurbitarum]